MCMRTQWMADIFNVWVWQSGQGVWRPLWRSMEITREIMDCDSERIWKMVEKYTPREKAQRRPDSLNLLDNLYNCYIDNCQMCQDKRFRTGVSLLEKLPPELARISIVVKLYGDESGYSIMLGGSDDQKETCFSYEDNELFSYLDAGEIPPILLEVLESTNHCHFYNGCLICEVRNYRLPRSQDDHVTEVEVPFESMLVLLKPSQETILQYVNQVCSSRVFSLEERLAVESKLLLATQSPLCLEPEIDVVCVQNRLHYNKRKYHSLAYKRYIRRQSQAKRAIVHLKSEDKKPTGLRLHLFLKQLKEKNSSSKKSHYLVNMKRRKGIAKLTCELSELAEEVSKYSKSYQSDVKLLIQQRNDAPSIPAPNQTSTPPVPTPADVTPTKKSPLKEVVDSKKPIPPKPKSDVGVPPVSKTSSTSGGLFVSLPRSYAQSALRMSKKATEQKIAPKIKNQNPIKPRPPVPTVSLHRSHIPGKTTITVISTSPAGTRNPTTIPNLPPKLHNPNIALKTATPSTQMPRLKPLEARTLTPPPPMNKAPPPLAPPPLAIAKPLSFAPPTISKPQLKVSPSSTHSMPQLHKIQVPTSSSEKPS